MINNSTENIGVKIQQFLDSSGITIERLKELTGIPLKRLKEFKHGDNSPTLLETTHICRILKIHPIALMGSTANLSGKNNNNKNRNIFSESIKKSRQKCRLSLKAASEELGIPENTLNDIESGDFNVDQEILQKMAVLYSTNQAQLEELLIAQYFTPSICEKLSHSQSIFSNLLEFFNSNKKIDSPEFNDLKDKINSFFNNSDFNKIAERNARYFSIGHLSDRLLEALQEPDFYEKVEIMAKEFMQNRKNMPKKEKTDAFQETICYY